MFEHKIVKQQLQTFLKTAGFGSLGPKCGTSSRAVTETYNDISKQL